MRYVEYDADGNVFHTCEATIPDPAALPLFASDEQKAAHAAQMQAHQDFGRSLQIASLISSHEQYRKDAGSAHARGIHILGDDEAFPTLAGDENTPPSHVFDHDRGKLRKTTVAEKKAHRDVAVAAREQREADAEAREQARVDKAVAASLDRRKV